MALCARFSSFGFGSCESGGAAYCSALDAGASTVTPAGRTTRVTAHPIGVDVADFDRVAGAEAVLERDRLGLADGGPGTLLCVTADHGNADVMRDEAGRPGTAHSLSPVPIVMAGGKKLPELDALKMAYRAVSEGAAGVDMGRNIFQSDAPAAMIQAVGKVVHEMMKPESAYEFYTTLKNEKKETYAK